MTVGLNWVSVKIYIFIEVFVFFIDFKYVSIFDVCLLICICVYIYTVVNCVRCNIIGWIDMLSFGQPIKRKKEGEEKRMTQEEMLLEAAQTGITWSKIYNEIVRGWDPLLDEMMFGWLLYTWESVKFLKINFYIAEIMNLRNLERVLAREEEVKKRAVVHKAVYSGPQIRYLSKEGKILSWLINL